MLRIGSLALICSFWVNVPALAGGSPAAGGEAEAARIKASFARLPLSFEANQGQADASVSFLTRTRSYALFLTKGQAVLDLPAMPGGAPRVLSMRLLGANVDAAATGRDKLPGHDNYFIGNDPKRWHPDVPTYARVQYREVYPGIDVVYYGNRAGRLEYDFIVAPGADPDAIRFDFANLCPAAAACSPPQLQIAANGDLLVHIAGEALRIRKPLLYQSASGAGAAIADRARDAGPTIQRRGRFILTSGGQVRFAIGHFDHARALIIDPVLSYSTYLGGNGSYPGDTVNGIAVDAAGNAYVTGYTTSTNFPTVNPFQATHTGPDTTVFVSKLNPAGSALVYSTYLGGSNQDQGNGIAVDSSGNVYLTGSTQSTDFPTANALQGTYSGGVGGSNAFVTKLSASGASLVYSTYLGGTVRDSGMGIAIDSAGNAYIGGVTQSSNFPTMNPYQASYRAQGGSNSSGTLFGTSGFVAKLNASGSALVYSTFLGGEVQDGVNAIAVDSAGDAYVTGITDSSDFPTVNAIQTHNNASAGGADGTSFVTKFAATGSTLVYSTYLGGSGHEQGNGIGADSSGNAYVVGLTTSRDFPVANALQSTNNATFSNTTAFVSKLNANGSTLVYSTYLGGSVEDRANAVAVDSAGEAYVAGVTDSTDFPTVNPYQSANHADPGTAFVSQLDASGTALIYSSYLGGSYLEEAYAIALDTAGNAYVGGATESADFPTVGPIQATNVKGAGHQVGFVTKFPLAGASPPAPTVTIAAAPTSITVGAASTLTWSSTNATACTASGAWSGSEPTDGTASETPGAAGSDLYTLTCTGAGGSANASATLTVNAVSPSTPTVSLAVNPTSITLGQVATLTWSSTNATACTASGAWSGSEPTASTQSETPAAVGSDLYTLTCTGAGGSANASATLTVNAVSPSTPTVTLAVNPTSITLGQVATLTWSSTNATACTASGAWSGSEASSGSLAVTPSVVGDASYTLTCSGTSSTSASSMVSLTTNAAVGTSQISGKAGGGGGFGLGSLMGLVLLVVVRLRRSMAAACFAPLALAVGMQASAQEAPAPPQFNWQQSYVGVRVGAADYTESSAWLNAGLAASGDAGTSTSLTRYRADGVVYAGVPFYRNLSLEVGFADLGVYPVSITTNTSDLTQLARTIVGKLRPAGRGITLGLAAPFDLGPWFAIEPRLAVLAYQSTQEVFTPDGTVSQDRRSLGGDAGFALLMRPTPRLSLGAGLDCFEGGGHCNVMLYSAVIEYRFGR